MRGDSKGGEWGEGGRDEWRDGGREGAGGEWREGGRDEWRGLRRYDKQSAYNRYIRVSLQ